MFLIALAALAAALCLFAALGLRAHVVGGSLDDYITARNSQSAQALGLSFLASGMGGWILFAPPEVGALVGPVTLAGYAVGAALPFLVFAFCGPAIRRYLPEGRSIGFLVFGVSDTGEIVGLEANVVKSYKVIPPFLEGFKSRAQATAASFCCGA